MLLSKRKAFRVVFKQNIVKPTMRAGVRCTQVSRELGTRGNLLTRWNRVAKCSDKAPFGGSETPRNDEMMPLKCELTKAKKKRGARSGDLLCHGITLEHAVTKHCRDEFPVRLMSLCLKVSVTGEKESCERFISVRA